MTWSRVKPRNQVHDAAHAKARKEWAARHYASDPCSRCGHELGPMGPHLHLDHDDYDKTIYRGFSHGSKPCPVCHRKCNLRAGSLVGNAAQKAKRLGLKPQTESPLRW